MTENANSAGGFTRLFDRFSIKTQMGLGFIAFLIVLVVVWQIGRGQLAHTTNDIREAAEQSDRISEIMQQVEAGATQASNLSNQLSAEMQNELVVGMDTNAADIRHLQKNFETTVNNLQALIESGEEDSILLMLEVEDIYEKIRKEYLPLLRGMAVGIEGSSELAKQQAQMADTLQSKADDALSMASEAKSITEYIKRDSLQAQQDAEDAMSRTLWVILLAVLVLAALSLNNYLVISRPVADLQGRIQDIAEGEGDLTQRIPVTSDNEFGKLAATFNSFLEKLSHLVSSVSNAGIRIDGAADQMQQVMYETQTGMNRQQAELAQMATAISQLSMSVNEVAERASDAEQAARGAFDQAGTGQVEVTTTIENISSLAQQIDQTTSLVSSLKEESLEIGGVLDVIKGIAEQTNLLALNAAIEAARAGEQGRGFAVVADEVRTLATRTQESTAEIHRIIDNLQAGADRAAEAMHTERDRSHAMVEQARKAGDALASITEAVNVIHDVNAQIASATEEQGTAARTMDSNVASISAASQQAAAAAERAVEEGNKVANMADDLNNLISRFRV